MCFEAMMCPFIYHSTVTLAWGNVQPRVNSQYIFVRLVSLYLTHSVYYYFKKVCVLLFFFSPVTNLTVPTFTNHEFILPSVPICLVSLPELDLII